MIVHDTVASDNPAMLRAENDSSFRIRRSESLMKVVIIGACIPNSVPSWKTLKFRK
jgi:hypothetical protein